MLKNYFKVALRTLARNKGYTLISVLGLAVGISSATLLLSYVNHQNSFDSFHSNSEQIVRPITIQGNLESPRSFAWNPTALASTLKATYPQVLDYTTLTRFYRMDFNINETRFSEHNYFITDPSFFRVFDFELISGDKQSVLKEPFSMVITEDYAMKWFEKKDVVGKVVSVSEIGDFRITGVLGNLPSNSHLKFDFLISYHEPESSWNDYMNSWSSFNSSSYLVLNTGVDPSEFRKSTASLVADKMPERLASMVQFDFQRLEDIYLHSADIERDFAYSKGAKNQIAIFLIISLFLLLTSTVNYINLSTAMTFFRVKEIGVRKVIGASRFQLINQFLVESLIITASAFIISFGLLDLGVSYFNKFAGPFNFQLSNWSEYLPGMLLISFIVGLSSGIFPALFLARFTTTSALKGNIQGSSGFGFRKPLVGIQFGLSIILMISTLVVSQQMKFIKEKKLGFDQDNLMVIDINSYDASSEFRTMRDEFSQIPGVEKVGVSSRVPGEWKTIDELRLSTYSSGMLKDSLDMFYMGFDENMIETLGLKLHYGTNFIGNDQSDTDKILINEEAVRALNLENPIGTRVRLGRKQIRREKWTGGDFIIIGVVKDFNFQSLHTEISPMVIGAWNNPASMIDYFTLKVSGDIPQIIEAATRVHENFDQSSAIEYHFLENQLELFYRSENESDMIFKAGTGLSIFISCLGLLGLISLTAHRRVKEIGIRRVLGASVWQMFYLLSSSFTKQAAIAFIIAAPVAFLLMKNWLGSFVYRIEITVGIFAITGFTTVLVAFLTVSFRAFYMANANPVDSLRQE